MTVPLYMDVHVSGVITRGLRRRGVLVLTSREDGTDRWPDARLLDRATELEHVLFTQDDDFLRESARRQRLGVAFGAVVFAKQRLVSHGECIRDLESLATTAEWIDVAGTVRYLPLR